MASSPPENTLNSLKKRKKISTLIHCFLFWIKQIRVNSNDICFCVASLSPIALPVSHQELPNITQLNKYLYRIDLKLRVYSQ